MSPKQQNRRIFLIRGLSREARHWGNFIPKLAESFPQAHIHPLEIPGTGKLNALKSPLALSAYIQQMRQEFLLKAQPEDSCHVIALSFGGMIAAHWASRYPQDFQTAVLINISSSLSPFYKRLRIHGAIRLFRASFSRDEYSRQKKIASLLLHLANPNEIAEQWVEIQKTAPVSIINVLRQVLAAATFSPAMHIAIPTLALCSKRDRLVSSQCSLDLADHWHIDLFYHETAGHDLPLDDPDWCISQIKSWW